MTSFPIFNVTQEKGISMKTDLTGKYLTFRLAEEDYGIPLHQVKEIIGMMPVTAVPQTPAHVKGVINLRGQVIPVSDLRLRFGMDTIAYNDRTCIIVVDIQSADSTTRMGVIVDAVSEVLNVQKEEIEAAPSFGALANTEFILGMANMDESVKILLDIDRVFDPQEIAVLEKAA
jgi:purine-binding chemotaxis protein CheW